MIIQVTPSSTLGTGIPLVRVIDAANGQTGIIRGSICILSSGQVALASTGPTSGIVGVAGQAYQTSPGYQQMNNPTTTTGARNSISLFAAAPATTVFASRGVNNSTACVFVAPVATDIGVNYGLTKQLTVSAGLWCLDKNLTGGSACVTVVDVDITNQIFYWTFMPTAAI